jgi:hypothetical protein
LKSENTDKSEYFKEQDVGMTSIEKEAVFQLRIDTTVKIEKLDRMFFVWAAIKAIAIFDYS